MFFRAVPTNRISRAVTDVMIILGVSIVSFLAGFFLCLKLQTVLTRKKGVLYHLAKFFHLIPVHHQFSDEDVSSPGQKDAEALYRKGRSFQSGRGEKRNLSEAQIWYRKAAKLGHLRAQLELAAISAHGPAELRDPVEAAQWWKVAAELGDEYAQYELGLCYLTGTGVKKNTAEALRCWQKASQQGEMHATCAVADCYAKGIGVKQDYSEAVRIWKKAAEAGSIEAQEKLRVIHR